MSSSFRVFQTYAGTIKRKEDFFTYYLANALDYIYANYPSLFSVVTGNAIDQGCSTGSVLSGSEVASLVGNPVMREALRAQHESHVFREVALPGQTGNLYLDCMFVCKSDKTTTIYAIEGKVFDRSVKPGQLGEYSQAIQEVFTVPVEVQLILLSTIRERSDGSPSRAKVEVDRIRSSADFPVTLVLWDELFGQLEQVLPKINDSYFCEVFRDASEQLKANTQADFSMQLSVSERIQYGLSEYLGDESAVSQLNELEENLLASGVRVERTYSARTSAMRIYLDDALVDQISLLVDWVNAVLSHGTEIGALEKPNESLRVTTVVQDRLQEQAKSAEVGRLGQCLKDVNVEVGVTAEVRERVEGLKAAIDSSTRGSLRSAVVDEFIYTTPDETPRLLLSRFIQGIGLKENPYLIVVSDATQAITALGVHVWSANSPKRNQISFLTLRQNMIVIPLSK